MAGTPPDPRAAARRELARALGGLALGPLRLLEFAFVRTGAVAAIERDLGGVDRAPDPTPSPALPARPLRLFLSCGETSSEAHAVRLARELRAAVARLGGPEPELFGLGGDALRAAGVDVVADPTARATMGGHGVSREIPFYLDLLERAARAFRDRAPDVFAPVDAPALHVPLARIAGRYGVPTAHLVAPQYWAWGPWRVKGYRRAVDLALTILPWEPAWFARHGVSTAHVGHPQVDVLAELPPAPPPEGRRELALLPGSRRGEIRHTLAFQLEVARRAMDAAPELRAFVAQSRDEHAATIRAAIEAAGLADRVRLEVGDLHAHLGRARAALAVSGTVLTDLLHHRLPTIVVYALPGRARAGLARWLVTCPWFASTNLLAGEEVCPEFAWRAGTPGPVAEVGALLDRALRDVDWRARHAGSLERAARRLGPPGAVGRAAHHVLALAAGAGSEGPDPAPDRDRD